MIQNPQKDFNFIIQIGGVDSFTAQSVTLPDVEVAKVTHGAAGTDKKTPGRKSVGDLVIEKLVPMDSVDRLAHDLIDQVRNFNGGGLRASAAYFDIVVKEMDATKSVAVRRHLCEECFLTKVTQSQFSHTGNNNRMETLTFSVNNYTIL